MQKLKNMRKQSGKTQEDMSKYLDVARNTYSRYETGEREPDFETLIKLADYFDVSIDYLLGRTDNSTLIDKITKKAPIQDEGLKFILEPDEEELIDGYRFLSDKYKETVQNHMRFIISEYKKDNSIPDLEIG